KKPMLVPDPDKAALVKEAFDLYVSELHDKEETRRIMRMKGLKLGKSAFNELFHNPLYCGKVLIKAHKNEPEQLISGQHEAIVSEEIFAQVQALASPKRIVFAKPNSV